MTTRTFDLCGPLPEGFTVLEASAGTGKTFAIAALAARYVAGGVGLDQMLLVTFTRAATGDLRQRVRERLVTAERGLADVVAARPTDPDDRVLRSLADADPAEIEVRRRRLATALAGFDAATITTTHGFCQQMLSGLGVAGGIEPDVTLVENVDDLVAEVVDDLLTARVLRGDKTPLRRAAAIEVARFALSNPRTDIAETEDHPDIEQELRVRMAKKARVAVDLRKRRARLITYDDLLTRLVDALGDEGSQARTRLRNRFPVVLVDEFQDTDELQWQILSSAFGRGGNTLVLIGDPKQAIYSFRGADVHAYLEATERAGRVQTLDTNRRSDQGLLDAYDLLFDRATLGHPGIAYRPVLAAPEHRLAGIDSPVPSAALRLRMVHAEDGQVAKSPKGWAALPSARAVVARDVASDVARSLAAETRLVQRDTEGEVTQGVPLRPGHIAVLTERRYDAAAVRDALIDASVPAVITGDGSVFATPVARDWLLLLEALERPTSPSRVRTAALTPFVGWTAADVGTAGDAAWEELHARLHHWAGVLAGPGVATLLELVTRVTGLPERLLRVADGERKLTDLRHIGQLLHAEAATERLGVTAMAGWLRRRIREADDDVGTEERSRRLESDAEAVQVLTIHRSKGLEFPVVYLPYLWDPHKPPQGDRPVAYHDRARAHTPRTIDVSCAGETYKEHQAWELAERRGEDLRLAYVALTRARHQAVVWWVGSAHCRDSPLGRLLFARTADGGVAAQGRRTPSDAEALARFEGLAASAPGRWSVERVAIGPTPAWTPSTADPPTLSAATWDRAIDHAWRRTSYTGLTADATEATVASEPEHLGRADERIPELDGVAARIPGPGPGGTQPPGTGSDGAKPPHDELRSVDLPLAAMPAGARVGSLIHAVLEDLDFTAENLPAAISEAVARQSARWPVDLGSPGVAAAGIEAAVLTPLGSTAGERRLADIGRSDRLDELAFELPVAGGDRPKGTVDLGDVADLVAKQLPAGDRLHGYPDRLRDLEAAGAFRGFLTGSLDLVARLRDGDDDRFVVMDYKTNRLGSDPSTLSAWDYRPEALDDAMMQAHYPLQALLYCSALHRYLRWRVAGYDPQRHIGGVLYLFLRGMSGVGVARVDGQPCGVWAWTPPVELVTGLSDLLEKGGAR